jgi:tetratricopeptide (TPR) repeat protein
MMDVPAFSRKAAAAAGTPYNREFSKGIAEAIKRRNLGALILKSKGRDGEGDTVRCYHNGRGERVVLRIIQESSGAAYYDLELTKRKGKVMVKDMFLYTAGASLSELIGQFMEGIESDFSGLKPEELQDQLVLIKKMTAAQQAGDLKIFLQQYRQLHKEIRDKRVVQIMHVQMCMQSGDDSLYARALAQCYEKYGNEPGLQLLFLDHHFYQGDYEAARQCVEALIPQIGNDKWLLFMHGYLHLLSGNRKEAYNDFYTVYRMAPDYALNLEYIISMLCADGEWAEAGKLLDEYVQLPKHNPETVTELLDTYSILSKYSRAGNQSSQ